MYPVVVIVVAAMLVRRKRRTGSYDVKQLPPGASKEHRSSASPFLTTSIFSDSKVTNTISSSQSPRSSDSSFEMEFKTADSSGVNVDVVSI